MRIGVDAMGGDNAPLEIVKGAVESLEMHSANIVLYGDKNSVEFVLSGLSYDTSRVEIIHCSEIVENEDKPVIAIRKKLDSSMVRGLLDLKSKEIDGFLSAGSTGALLAGGLLRVGRIRGIDRPALASVYPTEKGISILTDAGANSDVKPENLVDFGIMGSLYSSLVLGNKSPKVGLVNVGSEEGKGNEVTKKAYDLLKDSDLEFIGNIEGRDIPAGVADVIVTDGFTGNVILKLTEGLGKSFSQMVKGIFLKTALTKMAALLVKGGISDFKKKMDYTEYGGAPLLGVNGALVKAHGSSNAKAIKNAIAYTEKFASSDVIERINDYISDRS